jgi:hypothetical protein
LKGSPLKRFKEDFIAPAIELYMNKRLIVTDCESVIDYSRDAVVLCLGDKNLRVRGSDLTVNSFCFGQTDITGEIVCVEFV